VFSINPRRNTQGTRLTFSGPVGATGLSTWFASSRNGTNRRCGNGRHAEANRYDAVDAEPVVAWNITRCSVAATACGVDAPSNESVASRVITQTLADGGEYAFD
jgi:hypothetical protein